MTPSQLHQVLCEELARRESLPPHEVLQIEVRARRMAAARVKIVTLLHLLMYNAGVCSPGRLGQLEGLADCLYKTYCDLLPEATSAKLRLVGSVPLGKPRKLPPIEEDEELMVLIKAAGLSASEAADPTES